MFFGQILAKVAKSSIARCRTLCRILHRAIRRDIPARRFIWRLVRRRNDLLHRPKDEKNQKEIAEAELDISHAKMNRYLYEAAEETTSESNLTYSIFKASLTTPPSIKLKEIQDPSRVMGKWALSHQQWWKCREILRGERLPKDDLTPHEEEETKAALDEIMTTYQILQGKEREN